MAEIYHLESFGLTLATLKKLGGRNVRLRAYLRGPEQRTLFRYLPAERLEKMQRAYERQARQAVGAWPTDSCTVMRSKSRPYAIGGEVPAKKVHLLREIAAFHSIWIDAVEGRKARPQPAVPAWFTVHARFVIQIEGVEKGMQTYEERFVTLRAKSFADAERLVRPEFRAYARPYLNGAGEMVRWVFEEIVDIYQMDEQTFDGSPVEVFSTLKERRMRPDRVWLPRTR